MMKQRKKYGCLRKRVKLSREKLRLAMAKAKIWTFSDLERMAGLSDRLIYSMIARESEPQASVLYMIMETLRRKGAPVHMEDLLEERNFDNVGEVAQ